MFNEFTKLSIHNHFGGNNADYCFGESITKTHNFSLTDAKSLIDSANLYEFKLIGFTNHNHFWKDKFDDLVKYINLKKYDIKLLPGVEFDVKKELSDLKRLHVVMVISDQADLVKFESKVSGVISENSQNAITIEQLVDFCFEFKCILVPHGNKQKERGAICNHESFSDIISVRDYIPILTENKTKAKKEILISRLKDRLGSEDYEWIENSVSVSSADQEDFSNISEPTYIWAPATFDALFYSAIIGENRFFREKDIIEKSQYISKLKIKSNGSELKDTEITFSHGLNTIIGNSGSGKTLLLNLINKTLTGDNLRNAVSSSDSNYDKVYGDAEATFFDITGKEIELNDIDVFEGESLYKQVVRTISLNKKEMLKEFGYAPNFECVNNLIDTFNVKSSEYVKNKIKLLDSCSEINSSLKTINVSIDYLLKNKDVNNTIEYLTNPVLSQSISDLEKDIGKLTIDLNSTSKYVEELKSIAKKYEIDLEIKTLEDFKETLEAKIKKIIKSKKLSLIKNQTFYLIDNKLYELVSDYNSNIGNRALSINSTKETINNEISRVINNLKLTAEIERDLKIPVLCFDNNLIEDLKTANNFNALRLDNFTFNLKIDYDDLPIFFEPSVGSSAWKINKSEFGSFKTDALNLESKESVEKFLNVFVVNKFTNNIVLKNVDNFSLVRYETLIKKENGEYKNIESLSAGELSKIYINLLIDMRLRKMGRTAIVLYDQPDNNLEKEFILNSLVTKLDELKKKYQVIITTHEPLLVVNADSNCIIKAVNDPIAGKNNISFENITIYDSANKNEAIDKVAKLIDGDKDAIKLRNKIYGGNDIW